ncbi:MAG: 30S ribosomal protein S17 [Deltaproteobacteria bacterium]|nr:MAG: 30S ribosomal protein S17 [Deltaproteobacteria bacterium]
MSERKRGNPKVRQGVVIGDKMQKTVVVEVRSRVMHPRYKKYIWRRNRFKAHDEKGCRVGDRVEIVETRPLSKTKRWRVRKVLERSVQMS